MFTRIFWNNFFIFQKKKKNPCEKKKARKNYFDKQEKP